MIGCWYIEPRISLQTDEFTGCHRGDTGGTGADSE